MTKLTNTWLYNCRTLCPFPCIKYVPARFFSTISVHTLRSMTLWTSFFSFLDRQNRQRKRQTRSDKDTDGGWENICNEFPCLCCCICPCLCLFQNRQKKRQTRLGKGTDGGWENTCNGFPWICDRIWSDPCDFSSHFIHCQMKYYNNHTLLDQFVIERQNQTISSHYRCITLRTVWVSVRMFVFVFACVSDVSTCVCVCAYLCVFVVCIFAGLFCLCALNFHSKMKENYLHFARTKKTQIFSRMKNKTG